eukprot:769095-Amphidinium_carterae.1
MDGTPMSNEEFKAKARSAAAEFDTWKLLDNVPKGDRKEKQANPAGDSARPPKTKAASAKSVSADKDTSKQQAD